MAKRLTWKKFIEKLDNNPQYKKLEGNKDMAKVVGIDDIILVAKRYGIYEGIKKIVEDDNFVLDDENKLSEMMVEKDGRLYFVIPGATGYEPAIYIVRDANSLLAEQVKKALRVGEGKSVNT